jgi:hypothetical protein
MKKTNVTCTEVNSLIDKIVSQIKEEGIIINKIVGIAKGGLIPARLLAQKLGVKHIYSIGISFYNDENNATEPKIYQELPKFDKEDMVLIVDDILDSGITLKITQRHTRIKGAYNIWTSVLNMKENHGLTPDFFGSIIDKNQWQVYYWE